MVSVYNHGQKIFSRLRESRVTQPRSNHFVYRSLTHQFKYVYFFRTFINVNLPKKLISVFEADQNPSLRPGATWKELILQPTIVELFFELHLKVRCGGRCHSVKGSVFVSRAGVQSGAAYHSLGF